VNPTGGRWRIVRHRRQLSPARRRILLVVAAVTAMAVPVATGVTALVTRQAANKATKSLWTVPTRLEFAAEPDDGAGPPTRVRIPALKVTSPLEPLALDGAGQLTSPQDFGKAGWYADGVAPGDAGPAVIAGHVDSKTGPAVFYGLGQLTRGTLVEIERDGTWLEFRVTAVERYAKADFPSAKVYGPTPDAELRLITCGGVFDKAHNSYRDNVVVYAVLE
jgi:sortase (surface protein transpeptidase)